MEKLITAPATEPLSLTEAKLHLRVTGTDEDNLITALIATARQEVEAATGRALITQTWEYSLDEFPPCGLVHEAYIRLPRAPLVSISSFKYLNSENVETTIAAGDYRLVAPTGPLAERGHVGPAFDVEWPSDVLETRNAITIRYVAGYGAAGDVPGGIKSAMYLLLGDLYGNREAKILGTIVTENRAVERLLWPFKLLDI